jgi:hypothetical protein
MNEGMNESSMRCFDDSLIKKQGRTYSTDRSSLARYGDMSFLLAGSSKIFFLPPKSFCIPRIFNKIISLKILNLVYV